LPADLERPRRRPQPGGGRAGGRLRGARARRVPYRLAQPPPRPRLPRAGAPRRGRPRPGRRLRASRGAAGAGPGADGPPRDRLRRARPPGGGRGPGRHGGAGRRPRPRRRRAPGRDRGGAGPPRPEAELPRRGRRADARARGRPAGRRDPRRPRPAVRAPLHARRARLPVRRRGELAGGDATAGGPRRGPGAPRRRLPLRRPGRAVREPHAPRHGGPGAPHRPGPAAGLPADLVRARRAAARRRAALPAAPRAGARARAVHARDPQPHAASRRVRPEEVAMVRAKYPAAWTYHRTTSRWPHNMHGLNDPTYETAPFKEYLRSRTVALPEPATPAATLAEVLAARQSSRRFTGEAPPRAALPTVLHAGAGVIGSVDLGSEFLERPVPSGGGLYPLELYVLAQAVDGLDGGVYHYAPLGHLLEVVHDHPLPSLLTSELFLGQPYLAHAGALVVVTAVLER